LVRVITFALARGDQIKAASILKFLLNTDFRENVRFLLKRS
jgi:hypothetical protein